MIKANQVCKRVGTHDILRGISLEVSQGEVAVIIGPSGGGKSTFLRCINGLETFDSGSISVAKDELHPGAVSPQEQPLLRRIRQNVGMVFQQFHLFPHLTVLQNVIEAPIQVLGLKRDAAVDRAHTLLDRVGMTEFEDRMPSRLSGGQQQRVAIARALAMQPKALLFDEPTSALDPRMTAEVLSVLNDLASTGQTMLVVTHAMSFARRAATKVYVFQNGYIIESGPPEQIFVSPKKSMTANFLRETTDAS